MNYDAGLYVLGGGLIVYAGATAMGKNIIYERPNYGHLPIIFFIGLLAITVAAL